MKPPDRKSIEPFVRPVEISLKERFQTVLTLSLPGWKKEFCKVVLTFESVDENLWCDHLNETFLRILLQGTISGGGSRIFFRRGCTRLLLYFNTNKPHSFFLQNTRCIRKPAGHLGGGGVAHPLHSPPRSAPVFGFQNFKMKFGYFCWFLPLATFGSERVKEVSTVFAPCGRELSKTLFRLSLHYRFTFAYIIKSEW